MMPIEVDGGIKPRPRSCRLRMAADILVAGTSIFRAKDYGTAIRELRGE
jgi:pentose-5-phosphate-3-epimerase